VSRPKPPTREVYPHFLTIPTRWNDNDIYGHVNNAVSKLGNSSVTYDIGMFKNDEEIASAQGHFVHVYVDEKTRRPVTISDEMRTKLSLLCSPP